ncbi:MAG: multiheme c-type cytochrome [Hyphomicrobiaceae bacterium]
MLVTDRRVARWAADQFHASGAVAWGGSRPSFVRLVLLTLIAAACIIESSTAGQGVRQAHAGSLGSERGALFVGAGVCRECHDEEFRSWTPSDHARAMQPADDTTVLGDFSDTTFVHKDIEYRFFKRDRRFMVRTVGSDGRLGDFAVKYTFGVHPLQQYLVEFPNGRLQVLSVAWDSRPAPEGGQRWFHLYSDQSIQPGEALHWTGRYQSWNMQCASCHSTNLKKNYDAQADSYQTSWSEVNVACEACHGPGRKHVEWARTTAPPYRDDDQKALEGYLKSRWSEAWTFPAVDAKYAARDERPPDGTMNACWSCHARSSPLTEGHASSQPLLDAYHPTVLTSPGYYPDGQQRDEVYTWGSFLQSRMYARGVTCMDCHDPHALKLRAEGNALCTRCHNPAVFDDKAHHHHEPDTTGAACVSCHMPETSYMVIDARADHSFRVPRPDLTDEIGTPNACTGCHQRRSAAWASAALDDWYGAAWRERESFGTTLAKATKEGVRALPDVVELAGDASKPAIVRATAVTYLASLRDNRAVAAAARLLTDGEPLVRLAAIGALEPLEQGARLQLLSPLLSDANRAIRVEAARALADIDPSRLPSEQAAALKQALGEYEDSLALNADWPSTQVSLGMLRLRQGRQPESIAAFERAIARDPMLVDAYVALVEVYRLNQQDDDGAKVIQRGLDRMPRSAELRHALGLLEVRRGNRESGLAALAEAAELAPDNARFAYVYAIGLHSTGHRDEAIVELQKVRRRSPFDADVLRALISMSREAGNVRAALEAARELAEALPDDPDVSRLVSELAAEQSESGKAP